MTPREKAYQLVEKFKEPTQQWNDEEMCWEDVFEYALQCAKLLADEMLAELPDTEYGYFVDNPRVFTTVDNIRKQYWKEVKKELDQL